MTTDSKNQGPQGAEQPQSGQQNQQQGNQQGSQQGSVQQGNQQAATPRHDATDGLADKKPEELTPEELRLMADTMPGEGPGD